mmetsp:Transcript_18803/g.23074  ORF Transcript_18803/g.23074 Transcript_18803/m.23074 type:complete len:263 (+) Transcript_18803:98-886(+)
MSSSRIKIRPTIILFGDSITEFAFGEAGQVGWGSLLSSAYSRRADVLSRGFSGYNTRHALGVLPTIFGEEIDSSNNTANSRNMGASPPLLFFTVFFGANDASLPSARQYLSIDEYDNNLRQIISTIKRKTYDVTNEQKHNHVPIFLFTPPPVASKAWDHYCTVIAPRPLSPRSNENAKEYGTKVKQIGNELNCSVVDTFSLLGGQRGEDYYSQFLSDGLHLNGQGNSIVFDGLINVIKENHPELLPNDNSVPLEGKLWSELC